MRLTDAGGSGCTGPPWLCRWPIEAIVREVRIE